MPDTPTAVPASLAAGDTIVWRRDLPDYLPADGWALKYTFVGAAAACTVTATADGTGWMLALSATTTAAWPAGAYTAQEWVSKGTERYSLAAFPVRVTANLAAANAGIDLRSHARKVLDAIEAWLESRAPAVGQIEVAGRRISNYPIADLLALRDRYRAEVLREEAAAAGRGGARLLVRL